ncbi:unnamed protein product [Rhizophagus irregularis]|nr:unnamed protein product [Rhizophagus irregularis]
MTDYTPSNSKKNKTAIYGGHPKKPIWRFFEQEEDNMFGFNCLKVDHSIREAVIYMVEVREREISSGANVKRQNNDQTILEDFYENSDLSKERKEDIDTALIKAFLYRLLEEETLDGWTNPSGKSLWNFIIHLGNGWDILWKIRDFSGENYTAEFLAQQIQLIIEEIGIQKFAGIITDAGSNVINENSTIITSEAVKTIINRKCRFFNDVYDLSNVMKPIRDAILSLESSNLTLADCYFSLACFGQSINKISENENVNFRQHAIKSFNERFKMYNFDEYLLSYYIHPSYRGKKINIYYFNNDNIDRKLTIFIINK